VDGFTIVYGEGMEKWTPLSEVSELKEAAQKIAEEELQTQLIMNALPEEAQQIFVEDEIKTLTEPLPSPVIPTSLEKKRFVADNGVKYMWDNSTQDWVEDESFSQSESEEENEERNEVSEEGKSENPEKKRKRKKKKKDTSEWKDSAGSKFWIYIENLPLDITLDEMKSHFSKVIVHTALLR
jgi:hypothetical protein